MLNNYDAQLRVRLVVPDFDAYLERYRVLSVETRAGLRHQLDCPYGPSVLERVDVFLPDGDGVDRPMHAFLHGGYWRAFDKADYSFIARPLVESGAVAVIANYGLMPAVSMAQIVAQCRALVGWMHASAARYGCSAERISVSGHSAGAHIATLLCLTQWADHSLPNDVIKSTLAVSGIYDLEPVFQSFLRAETRMTAADVEHFSPIVWVQRGRRPAAPLRVVIGEDETAEFRRQSAIFSQALRMHGVNVSCLPIENRHHMNIVLDLGNVQTALGQQLVASIGGT